MRRRCFLALALSAALVGSAAATTVTSKAHIQVFRSGSYVDHVAGDIFDATDAEVTYLLSIGAIYPPGTGAPGSSPTGILDFTANAPTLPNVGAAFGSTGPFANYVLVKTVPAGFRSGIEIDNASGAQIAVVLDDGTAASAAAPVNATVFPLAGGPSSGTQGGSWSSQTFRGRAQIYAPSSGAYVPVSVN